MGVAPRAEGQALEMDALAIIAERKIQEAIDRGELSIPELHGKPIAIHDDFSLPWEVRFRLAQLSRTPSKESRLTDFQLRLLARRRSQVGRQG
jgi:hypothetical protein